MSHTTMDEPLSRRLELAADEALQGLCPNEWAEFDEVFPPSDEREALLVELEGLVAQVALADLVPGSLPDALGARLLADYERRAAVIENERAVLRERAVPGEPDGRAEAGQLLEFRPRAANRAETSSRALVGYAGWLVAAGVGFALFFATREREDVVPKPVAEVRAPEVPREPEPRVPTATEARSALLAHPEVRRVAWTKTEDATAREVQGDVVWDPHGRRGFMRFHGLAANDPKSFQYQLWIFDAERDEKHPVDGGVFDVAADGEVVVPIDPRVPVHRATLFAVTVEPPGGVVVSKRERIVVTAAVPPT